MKNFRKIVAILAAALMLFSVLPLSAFAGDAVKTFNFEDGDLAGWQSSCSLEVVDIDGNKALKWDASGADWANIYNYGTGIAAGTDYVVTLKVKADRDTNMNLKVLKGDWNGDTFANTFTVTTEWQDVTVELNTGDGNLLMFSSNANAANGATYYLDDIVIAEPSNEPVLEVGVVANGNFENGSEGWALNGSASIENGALKLDNSTQWAEAAMAEIAVEVDTEYTLSWKSQRISGNGAYLMFVLNADKTNHPTSGANWMNNTSAEWIEQSIKFTATAANLMLKISPEVDNPGVILIDDIKLTATPKVEVGKVTNGDFETGDLAGWTKWQSTDVSADAAYTGSYGVNIIGNGGWGGMLDQHINIEDGKTYELSFWFKVTSSGFNWSLKGDQSGTGYGSGWMQTQTWTQVTKTFVANGDTSVFLNFNGGNTGVTESAYIDDVMIKELKDPSDDGFIKNGDFETGKDAPWTLYSGTAVAAEAAKNGNYGLYIKNPTGGWGGTAFQDFSVEIGKSYEVTMWAKNLTGSRGQNIQIQNGGATVASKWFDNTFEWTLLTFEFTATATNCRINICGGGTYANEEIYVDDIKVKELKDPSFDGYITNGDFETGDLFPWNNLWGSCTTEIVEGMDGGYALSVISGKWKHVRQENIAVTPNTWYKVTAWAKNASDMTLLVKDGGDSANLVISGVNAGDEWTEFTAVFNSGNYNSIIVSLMGGENDEVAEKYGTFDNISMEITEAPCEHEWIDATCTDPKTCSLCGATEGDALGHVYADCADVDCEDCGAIRDAAGHNLTYVEAVIANNCLETGHDEYWECSECDAIFGDAEASWQLNPAWIYTTGECVRPEDAADCAVVPCVLCGNDVYGYGEHDVLACQGGTCSKCGTEIEGYGCANYDTPACEDGVCYYCGGFVAGFGHENGAWAACCDGECSYGCGLQYPASEDHVDSDADDYCDNCWNHLNHDVPACGGECSICWTWIEGEHTYFDACSAICEVCGYEREVSHNIVHVEAAAPTCNAMGNIEYWYCDVCGMAWLDADCTLNTNLRAVVLPATGEHVYDDDYDANCNVCGEEREVELPPVEDIIYGDVNDDGEVDLRDVAVLQQATNGWDVTLNEEAADVNGDGEVDLRDVALLQQATNGWDVTLGPDDEEKLFNDGVLGGWPEA